MINSLMPFYDKFISPNLLRRHLQYTIVALTRLGAVLAYQEILLAFMFGKTNCIKCIKLQTKDKEETERQRLLKMQQPTTEAINKQVSVELDEQLPEK